MMDDSKLKQALLENLEEEIHQAEREIQASPQYKFSRRYKRRKKEILAYAKRERTDSERRYISGSMKARRVAVVLISAVLLLVSASVAVAIVKPGIYYIIKDKLISWDITFDSADSAVGNESGFEYIIPTVPDGFEVVEETKQMEALYVEFANENGEDIGFFQTEPDGAMISMDSEYHKKREVTINGRRVLIFEGDTDGLVLFEDGTYAYSVEGNCEMDILLDIAKEVLNK